MVVFNNIALQFKNQCDIGNGSDALYDAVKAEFIGQAKAFGVCRVGKEEELFQWLFENFILFGQMAI